MVRIGPFRCLRGPVTGIVDVDFDGERLVLTRYGGLGLLDRYLLVLPGFALLSGAGVFHTDDGARLGFLAAAGAVLLVVLMGLLARVMRKHPVGTVVEVLEADIDLMDPLTEGTLPRLTLYSKQGDIVLRGTPWRASQLRRLQRRLAD